MDQIEGRVPPRDDSAIAGLLGAIELLPMFKYGTEDRRNYALRTLLSRPLRYESQMRILEDAGVSALINYASQPAGTVPETRQMALQLLFAVTFRLNPGFIYPPDINDDHFHKLADILVKYPDSVYYVMWTLYELMKFEQGRRGVINANIHQWLGKIMVSELNSHVLVASVRLLCELARDEALSDALIELNVFYKFRLAVHRCLTRNFLKGDSHDVAHASHTLKYMREFSRCSEDQQMEFDSLGVVVSYYQLFGSLPREWKEVSSCWVKFIITLIKHGIVIERATSLGQPIYEVIELIIVFGEDNVLVRLLETLSDHIRVRNWHVLDWVFRAGLIQSILARYPWCRFPEYPSSKRQLLEEVLTFIVFVLGSVPHPTCPIDYVEQLRSDYALDVVFQVKWPHHCSSTLGSLNEQLTRLLPSWAPPACFDRLTPDAPPDPVAPHWQPLLASSPI